MSISNYYVPFPRLLTLLYTPARRPVVDSLRTSADDRSGGTTQVPVLSNQVKMVVTKSPAITTQPATLTCNAFVSSRRPVVNPLTNLAVPTTSATTSLTTLTTSTSTTECGSFRFRTGAAVAPAPKKMTFQRQVSSSSSTSSSSCPHPSSSSASISSGRKTSVPSSSRRTSRLRPPDFCASPADSSATSSSSVRSSMDTAKSYLKPTKASLLKQGPR